jgi:hypothetical protein
MLLMPLSRIRMLGHPCVEDVCLGVMLARLAGDYNDPTVTVHFNARDLNASVEHTFDHPLNFCLRNLDRSAGHQCTEAPNGM